ncbi:CYP82F1 [Arabidopsis lyrata subsp. lyrata]|uniref:CYP82F1 n=2 Tax=Arabidopsis lyrata subsp. lyrata TaxID=81972 RepID=D7LK52_ARALL|nr:cytochrome P450 CYP82D47 isoform X1 [Arabidopsis lyrata subsp. lyrata]EFH56916.1 CYP82F1 [Arabidopsis lyrata subsp. lyrata]|eukprot:XP_002880657.1 cytochrome P450 CYP82D47 isoform X1 [Arabidopsis lyrata subsp. lyrata]
MDLTQLFLLSALFIFSVSCLIKSLLRPKNRTNTAPMIPGAWPLLGHLHLFDTVNPTHVTFGAMADVYGPVFMAKLGSLNVMVINSKEVAKEIYTVHDKLLERPELTASKILGYNDSFLTFSPYGLYWREMRKIAASELFSTSGIDMLMFSRAREADLAFGNLYGRWEQRGKPKEGVLVDMKQEFIDLTANISLMMVAGKRYFGEYPNCEVKEARRCGKLIREFLDYFSLFLLSDVAPALGLLEWKIKRGMKRTAKELDKITERWVEEHKNKRSDHGRSVNDYLDILIETLGQDKIPGLSDTHTKIKAICLNLVLAGSETAIVVLVWAVSLLLNNPHVLRKAQEELDSKIGKERVVEEIDIKDLVYLQAIVKETFRLYPPVPLIAYRDVMEDFDIACCNCHVPAGTQLMVSAWKIHRDPSVWSIPEQFEPERFLTSNREVDVGGQSYKFFPFGLGRRSCPAIPLGMKMVHYLLARFLHSFDLAKPSSQDVDMTESNGLVNHKATSLEVFITPRLHKSLYKVDHIGIDN